MPYHGELIYECRYCGKEIIIKSVVTEVECQGCKRIVILTDFLHDYLKSIFMDEVAAIHM